MLYAKGDEKTALELLNNLPSLYYSRGQKIEQLYPKGTKEYYNQLTSNLYDLNIFIGNKLGKYIAYNDNLSNEEKINKVNKLAKLHASILGDNDYEFLGMIIRGTIKEVIHISKLI